MRGGIFHIQTLYCSTDCFYLPPSAHFLKLPASAGVPLEKYQFHSATRSALTHRCLTLCWVKGSQSQRIHITTSVTTDPGPITGSPGCRYAGLLPFFLLFNWHFHSVLLSSWVTGACQGAQRRKSEHAEAESSHKLSGERGRPTSSLAFVPPQNAEIVLVFFPMNWKVVSKIIKIIKKISSPGRARWVSASAEVMCIIFALSGQFKLHLRFIGFSNTEQGNEGDKFIKWDKLDRTETH